jgi:hypothetical protein
MKAAFPTAPETIQGAVPMLESPIDLMFHLCQCFQTQKTPASATMNMLFCAMSPGLYSFFTIEAYPTIYFPFPIEVDAVPNFATCQTDNKCKTLKATYTHDQKLRLDTITMNDAFTDIFLEILPKSIRKTYEPIRMKEPNTVLPHMFNWFIVKCGKRMTKDHKENCQ